MNRREKRRLRFGDKPSGPRTSAVADPGPTPSGPGGKFAQPHDVDPIVAAMGADSDVFGLMPSYADIPEDFKRWSNPFNRLQSEWFFRGLDRPLTPKPGIDGRKAMAHLSAIQRSWTPPHEHKSAGVAYLMSLWFEAPTKESQR